MSDGNYNRNLLPYRDYQSGLRAGRAQTITRAVETLRGILATSSLSEQEQGELLHLFRQQLQG
ncbi:MAG: hypothetical protein IJ786_01000 [Bacteroidaceae bacterium]|nr:hypothetical protein [Bacteroidaceae bacterium]